MNINIDYLELIILLIALLIGLLKFSKLDLSNKTFVLYITFCVFINFTSLIAIKLFQNNILIVNACILLDFFILNFLFKTWNLYSKNPKLYLVVNTLITAFFITESILNHDLFVLNSYSRGFRSFVLVILSIQQINNSLFKETGIILLKPQFLVCIGLIITHTFTCFISLFLSLKIEASQDFYYSLYYINISTSILSNLLFTFAIFRMPEQKKFLSIDS